MTNLDPAAGPALMGYAVLGGFLGFHLLDGGGFLPEVAGGVAFMVAGISIWLALEGRSE